MTFRKPLPSYILIASLCSIILGAIGYYIWSSTHVHYDNISTVSKDSGLKLVLPKSIPGNAKIVDQPQYHKENGSITTRIMIDGITMTFSQQKRPETSLEQIDTQDTFLVNAGSVYVLKGEKGRLQAIVETQDSWLMVNSDAKIGVNVFRNILESLSTTVQ